MNESDKNIVSDIQIKLNEQELYICNLEKEIQIKDEILLQNIKLASLGELLKNITHQWRQPLAVINSTGTNMSIKQEIGILNNKDINKSIDTISSNVMKLTHTIDNFSILFQNSQYKLHFELDKCFEYVADILQPQIYEANILIHNSFEKIELFTYKSELMQVFMHILNNSIDILATNDNKEKHIFTNATSDKKNITIEIYDNARGIPQEYLYDIFNISFSTKGKNGSGSGLYMCKKLIEEKLKGKISVSNHSYKFENQIEVGAKFSIKIPRVINKEKNQYKYELV